MRIKSSIMIGVLVSVMTLCAAFADSVVTSKSYVDAQDALKQNKIPAKETGTLVLYNGIDENNQTIFANMGVAPYIDCVDAEGNGCVYYNERYVPTAGAVISAIENVYHVMESSFNNIPDIPDASNFQTKIPNPGSGMLVVYDGVDEDNQTQFTGKYVMNQFDCGYIDGQGCSAEYNKTDIPNMNAVAMILDELYSAVQDAHGVLLDSVNNGTPGAIVTYGAGSSLDERAILDGQYEASKSDNIPTAGAVAAAVQTIGNQPISVMECANPECTLWNISQRTVLSPNNNAPYSGSAFVNPADYTGYTPSNP